MGLRAYMVHEVTPFRPFFGIIVAVRTLFLTGGTGFVGSHVAREFLARGWRVRALVRRADRPGLLPREAEIVPGDLNDFAGHHRRLEGCAALVHCAGATRARSLDEFRRLNVGGTEALVRAASAACPDAPFVHVSSQAAAGPSRNGTPVREDDSPDPVSWYGRSKLESEVAVLGTNRGPWGGVPPPVASGPGAPA